MADEVVDAKQPEDSSSPLEGAIASSPEALSEAQEKVTETPTPQEGETPPVKEEQGEAPLHEHPRFKEVVDEKNWYKERLQEVMNRPQPTQPQQPQTQQDPYAGYSAEEQVFLRQRDERTRQILREEIGKNINPQIEAAKNEFARIRVEQFHKDHPDIKPNSPQETQIAGKISQGYLPEDAYRSVMWDKNVGQKRETSEQQQQQKLQAKRQANVVSPGSVSQASVPPTKETFDEEIARRVRTENITE